MAKLVSKTYGDALIQAAQDENCLDETMEEAMQLVQIWQDNVELGKLLHHPKITRIEKKEILSNIFGGQVSKIMQGFFDVLTDKNRTDDMVAILTYFIQQVKEIKGIGVAYVVSAMELKDEQKQSIQEKLLAVTAYRQIEMNYQVDTGLIGGLVIRIGDRVMDSSIRTKLDKMQRDLMKISLQKEGVGGE